MSETIKVDLRDGPKVETSNVTKVDLSKPVEEVTEEVATEQSRFRYVVKRILQKHKITFR